VNFLSCFRLALKGLKVKSITVKIVQRCARTLAADFSQNGIKNEGLWLPHLFNRLGMVPGTRRVK